MNVFLCINLISIGFCQFEQDIENALDFLQTQKEIIHEELNKYEIDKRLAVSIIFPELIRYSYLRDYIESASNEIFYVNWGEGYSNFSIGFFQMKPSFASRIETHIATNNNFKKYRSLFSYSDSKSSKEKRINRLNRLRDIRWQLRYLSIFIHIINDFHADIYLGNQNDLVKFYANCYNSGIWDDNNLNTKLKGMKSFPYGDLGGKINTHSYADFSLLFFNTLYDRLKN